MEYNSFACYENNEAEPKIKDFGDPANAVYTALQTGMSYPQVTSLVNTARLLEGKESGLALRHGHRWVRANGKGESVSRRTGRDRKDTFLGRPVHPDALSSLNRMIGEADQALLLQAVVGFEEEVQLEANAQLFNLEIDENDDIDNENDI